MKNIFLMALTAVSIFASSMLITDIILKKSSDYSDASEITVATEADNYKYRVSVFSGKLAVFEGNSKIPYKVYDTYINTLPECDIEALKSGIKVNTSSELMRLIEEYTS